jgi:transcription elongation factor Elf1
METRAILVERYIVESPYAEMALRLGLSEGAVKMRIQRGKLALRRILETDLADTVVAYGISDHGSSWHKTRLWCPICGDSMLEGYIDREEGDFALRCPLCYHTDGLYLARTRQEPELLSGAKGYKSLLNRITKQHVPQLREGLAKREVPCPWCGSAAVVRARLPDGYTSRTRESRGIHLYCPMCQQVAHISLSGLVADEHFQSEQWKLMAGLCLLSGKRVCAETPPWKSLSIA